MAASKRPRGRSKALLALVLLGATALAGCFGDDGARPVKPDGPCPASVCDKDDTDDSSGCVAGVVKDQDFQPIPGATVSLRSPPDVEYERQTAGDGSYSFCSLVPGTYTVVVTADGHEAGGRAVEVKAGAATGADFLMAKLPPVDTPWMESPLDLNGFLDCAVAFGSSIQGDTCTRVRDGAAVGNQHPLRSPEARSRFHPSIHAGLSAVAMLIDADQPPPTAFAAPENELVYRVRWNSPPALTDAPMIGPDGESKIVELPRDRWLTEPLGYPKKDASGKEGPTDPAWVDVDLAANGGAQFAYAQSFTLWVVFFYHGYPVPPDLSIRPDQ